MHVLVDPGTEHTVEVQLFDLFGRTCRRWLLTPSQLQASSSDLAISELFTGHYMVQLIFGTRVPRQFLLVADK